MGRNVRLVVTTIAAFLATAIPAWAGCVSDIINDWKQHGTIAGHYSQACYNDALANLPADLREYSTIVSAILAAKARDAQSSTGGGGSTTQPPSRSQASTTGNVVLPHPKPKKPRKPKPTTHPTSTTNSTQTSSLAVPITNQTTSNASVPTAKSSSGAPTVVIVLGVVAAILIGVGAGGLIAQRLRRRRGGADPDAGSQHMYSP